jgi:hypothetical protein
MAKARTLVGLDVHASKVVAAILDAETGELRFGRTAGETDKTVELCTSIERPVRVAYEAGRPRPRSARRPSPLATPPVA